RSVSRANIHHDTITGSGEHGIYFQDDNSRITNNDVRYNNGCGIKLASYKTDLYFHDDEVINKDYIGRDNIIANNISPQNSTGGSTSNAGIYLQAPLKNIMVTDNIA